MARFRKGQGIFRVTGFDHTKRNNGKKFLLRKDAVEMWDSKTDNHGMLALSLLYGLHPAGGASPVGGMDCFVVA